jgi:hypothetical protein
MAHEPKEQKVKLIHSFNCVFSKTLNDISPDHGWLDSQGCLEQKENPLGGCAK